MLRLGEFEEASIPAYATESDFLPGLVTRCGTVGGWMASDEFGATLCYGVETISLSPFPVLLQELSVLNLLFRLTIIFYN